ncbi:hypothetical protein QAD02_020484 [Eretmocerus hayati]|uniref:Uncharacterized protein n=1 Tax=Eretmocerus hayati TaxID=131215 RepID=A0ACC2PNT9_9HYME|nr:hypothetical protein QAD02_020484 [Eretmocerus hayati]
MTPRKKDAVTDAVLSEKRRSLGEKKNVASAGSATSELNEASVLPRKSIIMNDESSDGEMLKRREEYVQGSRVQGRTERARNESPERTGENEIRIEDIQNQGRSSVIGDQDDIRDPNGA